MKKNCSIFVMLLTLTPWVAWGFDFEHTTLENGLDVYVVSDHRTPVVVNFVWYKAGAGDEENGKTGLAHMLEHLMFKGTENIPPQEFSKIVARHGGKDNAFTSYDYTAYYQKVAKENLLKMMEIEADRMQGLTFTDAEFQPERDVILEERRMRVESKPQNRFFEEFSHVHMPNHPYGRPVIGWQKDIENYTYQMNHDWYKKWYHPNNAFVILIGDITLDEAKPMLAQTYAKVPNVRQVNHHPWTVEPAFDGAKRYQKVDKAVQVPLWARMYRATSLFAGIAGAKPHKDDTLPLMVMAQILGGGNSSYLYQKLVKEGELADSVSVSYSSVQRGESSVDVVLVPKEGVRLETLEHAYEQALTAFSQNTLSDAQVKRAITLLKSYDVYGRDDPFVAAYHFGKFMVAGGKAKAFDDWLTEIEKVTAEDVLNVANKYLQVDHSTTGLLVQNDNQF